LTLPAFVLKSNPPFSHLIEGEHQPWQQVDCLADECQVASEGIPWGKVGFPGAWRFKNKRVWCKGLPSEHRTLFGDRRFKAFGVDASIWKTTLLFALRVLPDTRHVSEDVSELPAEDVAFVRWHFQGFLDSIGETVACESKVFELGSGIRESPVTFHHLLHVSCSVKRAFLPERVR